jgi:hypothetical protein
MLCHAYLLLLLLAESFQPAGASWTLLITEYKKGNQYCDGRPQVAQRVIADKSCNLIRLHTIDDYSWSNNGALWWAKGTCDESGWGSITYYDSKDCTGPELYTDQCIVDIDKFPDSTPTHCHFDTTDSCYLMKCTFSSSVKMVPCWSMVLAVLACVLLHL